MKTGHFREPGVFTPSFRQNSMIFSEYTRTLAYFLGNSKIGEKRRKSVKMCLWTAIFHTCRYAELPSQIFTHFHDFRKLTIFMNSSILAQYCGIRQESRGSWEQHAKSVGKSWRISDESPTHRNLSNAYILRKFHS